MKKLLFLIGLTLSSLTGQSQIIHADFSDPDACEGDSGQYWLTASSFQCTPGLPILRSDDMTHWTLVNYALQSLVPLDHYANVQHGCGVWAPSIRKHDDTYYIYWGDPDYGIFMTKTHNPAGKWDDPVLVVEGKGLIDPCPLWVDGRAYLVNGWANSRCGFNSILPVRELTPDGTSALTQPVIVYDGLTEGNHTIEGPKFYHRDGYFYILAPAGGVATGHQLALRSKSVYGPYESKIVFNKDGIHQGAWVKDKFVCFQERSLYGRILHLLDVNMKDGWPMMQLNKHNTPSPLNYSSPALAYQWHANYNEHFGFSRTDGCRVYGHLTDPSFTNFWSVPNLYLKKFEGEVFSDTLHCNIMANAEGQQSGFIVMGRDYARIALELTGERFVIKYITCHNADNGTPETVATLGEAKAKKISAGAKTCYAASVRFVLSCAKGGACTLSYSVDDKPFSTVPSVFQAREGRWIGAKYGVYSIAMQGKSRGWIDLMLQQGKQ